MSPTSMLVIRDRVHGDSVANALRQAGSGSLEVQAVDDVYEALAEVAARVETFPIETVAVPLAATDNDPQAVGEAFRRIDPSLDLVLLAPSGAKAPTATGFDRIFYLSEPANSTEPAVGFADLADALQHALPNAEGRGRTTGTAVSESHLTGADAGAGGSPMRTERRPQAGSPASTPPAERDVVDLVVGDALAAFATRRARDTGRTEGAAPASPPSPSEEIGDIDLVDAVLAGGGRLPALAVAVASRESGIADLRLEPAEEAEGDHTQRTASVEVRHGEIPLGRLVSAQAGIEELRPWADWLAHWLHLDGEHQQLAQLAWLDELTGAGNRRAFERRLDEAIASARRERRPVTLMYFDVDDLKLYNDRFGHDAGDAVLSEVVELLQAVIRRGDQVFRVGGDEFVVIFSDSRGSRSIATPGLGIESVSTIAHRFRERVSELRLHQLGLDAPGTVSISAGLATYPWDGYDARSLLAHADQLALQSKRSGKNKISFGPGAKDHCAGA